VTFEHADAFSVIKSFADDADAFFFVDPPYTAGGKNAGKRLYAHNELDHERLFSQMAAVRGSVMMTYDDAPEVRGLAERHGFRVEFVPMKNTHHALIRELLILKP
jgi:DNA adenine methylase